MRLVSLTICNFKPFANFNLIPLNAPTIRMKNRGTCAKICSAGASCHSTGDNPFKRYLYQYSAHFHNPNETILPVPILNLSRLYLIPFLIILTVSAACAAIEVESVELGFSGTHKRDRWSPLQVTVTSQNEAFRGEIYTDIYSASSGKLIQSYSTPLSLTRTDRQRRILYVFLPGISTKLMLRLIDQEGRLLTSQEIPTGSPKQMTDLVALALTPSRDLLNRWNGKQIGDMTDGNIFVAYVNNPKYLPTNWKGYDSIDLIILRELTLSNRNISESQQTALLNWIQGGGTLLTAGGRNFHMLRGGIIEPFMPVELATLQTRKDLPEAMRKFGFTSVDFAYDLIDFQPQTGGQILIGSEDWIYVARKNLGSGSVISLAFDYTAPPFSDSPGAENYWEWLFKEAGRSARYVEEARYAAYRRHNEKIQALLTTRPSTRSPLILVLAGYLIVYLMSLGGLIWFAGRRENKPKLYWIGGLLLPVFFFCAVIIQRNISPGWVSSNSFSILSVYSETERAHLQSYIGMIASTNLKTSINFGAETMIRPLTPLNTTPLQLIEAREGFKLHDTTVDAWAAQTYLAESFVDFPSPRIQRNADYIRHHLPGVLENAWLIERGNFSYLGSIRPNTAIEIKEKTHKWTFPNELVGMRREEFARILVGEGLLRYLAQEDGAKLIGWLERSILPMSLNNNNPVNAADNTLVILHMQ